MTQDAKFEDASDQPLALQAADTEDLKVVAALTQDSVFPSTEMTWATDEQRFGLLLNRFRWEDRARAETSKRDFERVQTVLVFDGVTNVATTGIDVADKDLVLSLLDMTFTESKDGAGEVELVLAGDGGIKLSVDVLAITLKDVTRPYSAPSKKAPSHKIDD